LQKGPALDINHLQKGPAGRKRNQLVAKGIYLFFNWHKKAREAL